MADAIRFDWDSANVGHLARHNIRPLEAEEAVLNSAEIDLQLVDDEERLIVVGVTKSGRFLTIACTSRRDAIRVITGWNSTKAEEAVYWGTES